MNPDKSGASKPWLRPVLITLCCILGAACSSTGEVDTEAWKSSASPIAAPVVLEPNFIHGTARFTNTNPEILEILQTEGMDLISASAISSVYAAHSDYFIPENSRQGAFWLSAEANGGAGSVTYSVGAIANVNRGARSGQWGRGSSGYRFQPQLVTLRPADVQPDGVTVDLAETVGVVRIRFGTDSSCSTPVPIFGSEVSTDRGINHLNITHAPGYSMGYHLMRGGTSLSATLSTTIGTNPEVDTITFEHTVEFHAGPDEIQDVCIPIPTGAANLGAIATPNQVFGHTLVPGSSFMVADLGPNGNRRYSFFSAAPVDQPSTWPRLPNLMPGDYLLWNRGLLEFGDAQVLFSTNGIAPPYSSRTAVTAGQTTDAKQTFPDGEHYPFVSHPAHFSGNILLDDPYLRSHPSASSSLSALTFHTLWPTTRPDYPGGTVRGPGGGTALVATSGPGLVATSFSGRFQANQGKLVSTYSLPVVSIYDQPETWRKPRLRLAYASQPTTRMNGEDTPLYYDFDNHFNYIHPDMAPAATYRLGMLTLARAAQATTVRPGEAYTQDHHYCFNEVRLQYIATQGFFVNPAASISGGFNGTDFEGNTVHYTGEGMSYGTPAVGVYQPQDVFLSARATTGFVAFSLPQGTWHLSPRATFVDTSGKSIGNFVGVDLTLGCGQRVDPLPGLSVSLSMGETCQEGNAATITGTVNSGEVPIDHIWYTLNEQTFDLCTSECSRNFSFTVPSAYAGATVTVYASSPFVQGVASVSDTLPMCPPPSSGCVEVRLSDYNLFLSGDYSGGHDVEGKVAAGGNITMADFSVGAGVPVGELANTLVAGNNLSLSRGGAWGEARYASSLTADSSVVFPRGSASQGTPIDFASRAARLRTLSSQLASLTATGMTTLEPWGGVMLKGTDPHLNVFQVNASAFTGAKHLSIDAPAGSLALVNISGSAATFTGFGHSFGGGIDQHDVLYNFVDATSISAEGYGFWGTVLAPLAHIRFDNGSFDGGIYALSLTGNAEGHINPLNDRDICQ